MRKVIRYNIPISVVGIIVCILLIVSKIIGQSEDRHILALNQLLVVGILCLCIHFVRRVSAVSHIHVWDDRYLLFLVSLPVVNLLITGLQLTMGEISLFSEPLFRAVMTVFSLPVFFCDFFIYAVKKICDKKIFGYFCCVLWGTGTVYFIMRLLDRTLFPLLQASDIAVSEGLVNFVAASSYLATAVYVVSVLCFVVLMIFNDGAASEK